MFCSVILRAKLETLFRRCIRLALRDVGPFPLISTRALYCIADVLPLRLLFQYTSAVLLYKILVLKQIPALLSLFTVIESTSRSARLIPTGIITLRLPSLSLELTRHGFAYWGAKLWNTIPNDIRRCALLSQFSRLYLTHLKSHLGDISISRYDLLDFV